MATQHEQKRTNTNSDKPVQLRRRSNLRPVVEIYWSDLESQDLRLAIDAVTRMGGAILFGRTSDGGALSICILDGNEKIKEYPHTVAEAAAILTSIVEEWVGI